MKGHPEGLKQAIKDRYNWPGQDKPFLVAVDSANYLLR